ncbi:hypothetical protein LSH36_43g08026 [Paralvinella palmiformis]|uniref:Uncharacterized protein n=1 Tax=Paralvinella palmiformis TaxID=53620 RepID=A0AAD9K8P4_9ANNE|nr:hypothetical protein LSH36_43g08026 [Paralvinella palmiformis]
MMFRLKDLEHLCCIVTKAPRKYIYFTKVEIDTLLLCVTNGHNLWKVDLNPPELEIHRKVAGVEMEQFLQLINHKSKSLEFKLLKASETDTKTTLHDMLFFLAERSKDQQKQLERAASTIENLKKPTQRSAMFDLNDVKSSKTAPKVAPKQPGMSVINPGSKRKKLAKGIEFD